MESQYGLLQQFFVFPFGEIQLLEGPMEGTLQLDGGAIKGPEAQTRKPMALQDCVGLATQRGELKACPTAAGSGQGSLMPSSRRFWRCCTRISSLQVPQGSSCGTTVR